MALILTTKGEVDADTLDRRTIFEVRAKEFVVAVEYRLEDELVKRENYRLYKDTSRVLGDNHRIVFEERDDEFVTAVDEKIGEDWIRRDCNVLKKHPSVTADAIVGGL